MKMLVDHLQWSELQVAIGTELRIAGSAVATSNQF